MTKRQELLQAGLSPHSLQTKLSNDEHGPYCEAMLNATSSQAPQRRPCPGDLAICAYCGGLLEFDDRLHQCAISQATLNGLTNQELEDLAEAIAISLKARKGFIA